MNNKTLKYVSIFSNIIGWIASMGILVTLILNFYYETSEDVLFNIGFEVTGTSLLCLTIFFVLLMISTFGSYITKKLI
ncbi:hypothetical protein OXR01_10880 [Staphylococcus gallinarum]|uniref:hypothetical protein n=1 Tax=Staphylococcus gallinarum TaxID=1293 RepID=UPI000D1C70B7|nr:hypothetical protein [Staphylococcus gallinarum]MCD8794668.1 hypothetical protein [Staphylococcus gallinarum]MDN6414437.1 hypothetical protein [Staphylococcus gallinarum]PTE27367.1 hypothetical protein BUZ00_14230 [Staphylococcus gallinarum]RIL18818.1 hypothetical protein BUY97_14200 [Staphylococcus gallinarum]RIL19094.1 hypothetical protein BUY99_12750 [Staphylococcus gallinarum]